MNAFAEFVVPILAQTSNLRQKNANLRRTRDLLLPRLVAGEVEVGGVLDHEFAKDHEEREARRARTETSYAGCGADGRLRAS